MRCRRLLYNELVTNGFARNADRRNDRNLRAFLESGDTIIDGGKSFYKDKRWQQRFASRDRGLITLMPERVLVSGD
jgi:hypothetical protein